MNRDQDNGITLTDQVAILTGGGRGIGKAIAERLANADASVAIDARSSDQLAETVKQISKSGFTATSVTADDSDPDANPRMVHEVEETLGSVDLLVNNAGLVGPIGPTGRPNRTTGGDAWKSICADRCYAQGLSCRA